MKINVNVDPKACFIAGIEPVNAMELDLQALSAEDRARISSRLVSDYRGLSLDLLIATPTIASILEAIQEKQNKEVEEKQEQQDRIRQFDEINAAYLAERKTEIRMTHTVVQKDGLKVEYEERVMPTLPEWQYSPTEQQQANDRALGAWRAEVKAHNEAVKAAAYVKLAELIAAQEDAVRAKLAAVKPESLIGEGGLTFAGLVVKTASGSFSPATLAKHKAKTILSSNAEEILVLTECRRGPLYLGMRGNIMGDSVTVYPVYAWDEALTETEDHAIYELDDGVLTIEGSAWAATSPLDDHKPKYAFLTKCPGGYKDPGIQPGDLLIWAGPKDRKGRGGESMDRLVFHVDDGHIYAIQTDYKTARKLAKRIAKWQATK